PVYEPCFSSANQNHAKLQAVSYYHAYAKYDNSIKSAKRQYQNNGGERHQQSGISRPTILTFRVEDVFHHAYYHHQHKHRKNIRGQVNGESQTIRIQCRGCKVNQLAPKNEHKQTEKRRA